MQHSGRDGRSGLDASRSQSSTTRRVRSNVVTAQDYEELKRHYRFVLPESAKNENGTWQDRMVNRYHQHLYKEFAIADLSIPSKIGLRFRTKAEVVNGRGYETCGNKHCLWFLHPERYTQATRDRYLARRPGSALCDYEVPFQYVEHNETKVELVKLRLCQVCTPLLMERCPGAQKRDETSKSSSSSSEESSSDSSDDDSHERRRKSKRRRRRKERSREKVPGDPTNDSNALGGNEGPGEEADDDDSAKERTGRRHHRKKKSHKRDRNHKKRKHGK